MPRLVAQHCSPEQKRRVFAPNVTRRIPIDLSIIDQCQSHDSSLLMPRLIAPDATTRRIHSDLSIEVQRLSDDSPLVLPRLIANTLKSHNRGSGKVTTRRSWCHESSPCVRAVIFAATIYSSSYFILKSFYQFLVVVLIIIKRIIFGSLSFGAKLRCYTNSSCNLHYRSS